MRLSDYYEYAQKFSFQVLVQKLSNQINKYFITPASSSNNLSEKRSSKEVRLTWLEIINVDCRQKLNSPPPSPITPSKRNILGAPPSNLYYNEIQPGFEGIQYDHNLKIDEFDTEGNWLSQVVRDSHLEFSQSTWKLILSINPNYSPIDWQKDIKTGFRWDAKIWHKDQGKLMKDHPGVDIKNPWEVSRLQHLPMNCLSAGSEQKSEKLNLYKEVVCEILDFVMANPIGMGVNFNCPMDVGIRHANMLVCLDYLQQDEDAKDLVSRVESIIGGYISESTKHILDNLEYRTGLTSNHYLANVMGTLFAGAYINSEPMADSWLLFSIQEIENCMNRQFFIDGSNFEGSTSYHRLSSEMMLWATLVVLSLPEERIKNLQDVNTKNWKTTPKIQRDIKHQIASNEYVFSKNFWRKLINAIRFTDSITKQNGDVFQYGDNDSGRFVQLSNTGVHMSSVEAKNKYLNLRDSLVSDEEYWDENSLNHKALLGAGIGLFDLETTVKDYAQAEFELFTSVPRDRKKFLAYIRTIDEPYAHQNIDGAFKETLEFHKEKHFTFDSKDLDITKNSSAKYFSDFQLAVIKNNAFSIALGGISNPKQHHSLGHTHNDKLAIELQVNGEDILFNPGTYVYTPNPKARYVFRSVKSHNTISVNGQEQNRPLSGGFGLFNLKNETKFKLIKLTETEIIAEVRYRKVIHQRRIKINPKSILVQDWCNHKFEQHWNTGKPYSNGYGKRLA